MESELITRLRQRLPPHPLLALGPGDDAAILRMAEVDDCVVTVDLLTDGVDFELANTDPRRIGRKALAVNLSDLAAMAAEPIAAVIALVVPRQIDVSKVVALYEGLLPLAERYGVAVAGGDTNSWDGPLAISITALGKVVGPGPLRRDGAQPGDRIVVTGRFGGSILGEHLDFEPRVREAMLLNERFTLHAGIDVSDGLSIDLAHLTTESDCGAVLRFDRIPIADDAVCLAEQLSDGVAPLEHALADGEDFELILAVPEDQAGRMIAEQPCDVPLTLIGEFIAEPGLWAEDADGDRQRLEPRGWQHEFGE